MKTEGFTEAELDLVRKRLESGVYVGEDHHVRERLRLLATIAARDEQIAQLKMEIDCMTPGPECSRQAVTQPPALCNHHFRRIKIAEQDAEIVRLQDSAGVFVTNTMIKRAERAEARVTKLEAALDHVIGFLEHHESGWEKAPSVVRHARKLADGAA